MYRVITCQINRFFGNFEPRFSDFADFQICVAPKWGEYSVQIWAYLHDRFKSYKHFSQGPVSFLGPIFTQNRKLNLLISLQKMVWKKWKQPFSINFWCRFQKNTLKHPIFKRMHSNSQFPRFETAPDLYVNISKRPQIFSEFFFTFFIL